MGYLLRRNSFIHLPVNKVPKNTKWSQMLLHGFFFLLIITVELWYYFFDTIVHCVFHLPCQNTLQQPYLPLFLPLLTLSFMPSLVVPPNTLNSLHDLICQTSFYSHPKISLNPPLPVSKLSSIIIYNFVSLFFSFFLSLFIFHIVVDRAVSIIRT